MSMADGQFDPTRVRRWRRDVWRLFAKEGFRPAEVSAALVLAGVAFFGTDLGVLSELTGSSPDYCRKILRRLRKQRVLRGTTLHARWHDHDEGYVATMLDAGVAAGIFVRGVNQKRSAAQKARAPETRARGPRRPRTKIAPGAVFTPKIQKADPLYGLPEWEKATDPPARP
jgi:hypothetical protein